jgi:hypothetical protein
MGVALGSQGQTTVFPVGLFGPIFLKTTNVRASRIYLIVSLRLEVVQGLVVVGEIGLTSTRFGIRTLYSVSRNEEM